MEERYEIKVIEHSKLTCRNELKDKVKQRWERVRGELVRDVEKEWSRFKEVILIVREQVCR